MKQRLIRLVMVAVVVALGIWAWRVFFPSPEKVIRQRLLALAHTASFAGNEGSLAKMDNAQRVTTFCTADVEFILDVQGYPQATVTGRDELLQGALAMRTRISSASIEFLDIVVTLAPNKASAFANLTARVKVSGERDMIPQELKITLKKIDGKWLIRKVETVKTLGEWNVRDSWRMVGGGETTVRPGLIGMSADRRDVISASERT